MGVSSKAFPESLAEGKKEDPLSLWAARVTGWGPGLGKDGGNRKHTDEASHHSLRKLRPGGPLLSRVSSL